jgi:hypothetical protein
MTPVHVARLIDVLIALFDPVVQAVENADSAEALLRDMGYQPPAGVAFLDDFSPLLGALLDVADQADEMLRGEAEPDYLALFRGLLDALRDVIALVRDIGATLQANFPADFLAATDIAAQFPRQLADYLVVRMLERQYPVLHGSLLVSGIIDQGEVTTAATAFHTPYKKRVIRWDKIGGYVSSPLLSVQEAYGWNTDDFDYGRLVDNVHRFGQALGFFSSPASPEPDALRAFNGGPDVVTADNAEGLLILKFPLLPVLDAGVGIEVYPLLNAARDKVAGLGVGVYFDPAAGLEFPITDRLTLRIKYAGTVALDAGVSILPGQPLQQVGSVFGGLATQADLSVFTPEFAFADADQKTLLLDTPLVKLEFASSAVRGGVLAGVTGFYVETAFEGATLTLGAGEGDGFLRQVLPAEPMVLDFSLTVGFSSKSGLYFGGSSALEVRLPAHVEIGPVAIQALTIGIKAGDAEIPVRLGADVKVALGPLVAVIENVGVAVALSFPADSSGNLGPLQFDLGFKPPNGVGLSLDAGGFKGGGFLRMDSEKGEYVGALELDFKGLFSVKAIGIINTKMPDGSRGFSLLIVIAAEFTPIQLSFGFTLNGVGGIFGLNRTIVVAALAEGIRTNAVKSILFPENVVANVSRIVSDIKQFFPPRQDHFVVGPMAKLGWGTPSLITVELGLLLDLPDPMFAVVGVLKAVLPDQDAPVLRLQVNFLGVVDFDRGYIFFRADLFDSRLLVYSITGSMAFLVSWGEAQTFALSVGGFHPDFRDVPSIPALPDGFRSMARIGISLLSDDNPRLKVESYFAVTSNTAQFGARVELYAESGGFNIYGFLGYDVLFHFDPFLFIAKLSGGIALRRHSTVIAGINISATLSGPTPWDARGKATLSLLFFSISVGFHATWGDPPPAIAGATEDLLALLQRELADSRNWRAELPANNHLHVSLRKIDIPAATGMVVIHPAGVVTFSQRSLPVEDFAIQTFGSKKPLAENKFKFTSAQADNVPIPADFQSVREQFAPGTFLDLSDSERLSRKSFDSLPSGFKLSSTSDLLTTLPVPRPVEYELSYLRRERIVPKGLVKLFVRAYERLVKGSAVRQSGLSHQQKRVSMNAPPQVGLPQETFAVANAADLKSQVTTAAGPVLFATQAEAYQRQRELIASNPALAGQLQVISHFELNPN